MACADLPILISKYSKCAAFKAKLHHKLAFK